MASRFSQEPRQPNARVPRAWLVLTRDRGMDTTDRPVCCASALMKEVLPVPGGPCIRKPSFWG